jgi:protein phosphatase
MTEAAVAATHVDVSGLTDVGRRRKTNEDHFIVVSLQRAAEVRQTSLTDSGLLERLRSQEALLLVVADGVGGRGGGDIASSAAVTGLVEYVGQAAGCLHDLDIDREHEFLEQLERAVRKAHHHLLTEGGGRGQGPATTLTMAALVGPRAYLIHVGDSKAYYLRRGRLRKLTRDHTTGEYMVDAGAWTEEQARTSPVSGNLFSALGGEELIVSVGLVDLVPGDVLLLCTDGLTNDVPDARIEEILGRAEDAASACRALVDEALAGGGSDNITVLVARMSSPA